MKAPAREGTAAPRQRAARSPADDASQPATIALPLRPRVALALSALSGFFYFLAFPGVGISALGLIAYVPLIVALHGQTPRRGLWMGWVAGLVMTGLGFYWLLEMLQTFSGFPLALCAVFVLLLSAYQAGRMALFGWLSCRAQLRDWPLSPVLALAFIASELTYPLLFPWYYGAVVHAWPAWLQSAEMGGPIAVGLVVLTVNLALAEPLLAFLGKRPVRPRAALLLAMIPLVAIGLGMLRIRSVDARVAAAPKGRVGVVQANMSLFGKREDAADGLARHLRLTRKLTEEQALDLVVWSETSVMGAVWEHEAPFVLERAVGRRVGAPTLFGAVLARPVDDVRKNVLFNSAVLTDRNGKLVDRYDKHYRLPFGEYLPFGDVFPVLYSWSPNSGRFARGESARPLKLGHHELATFICYEDVLPGFVNGIVRAGSPDLLVNLTNDAWFGDTTEPWIHLALSQLRAVEHRRFLVRSTNSGVSAIIDPAGRVLAHSGTFTEEVLSSSIAWLRGRTLYAFWGDLPWWAASCAAFLMAFWRKPPRGALRLRLSSAPRSRKDGA